MRQIKTTIEKYFIDMLDLKLLREPELLSQTNNDVYLIQTNKGFYTFKILSDLDIDLNFVKVCNEQIAHTINCQKIIHLGELNGKPIVVSEYMQGRDLRDVIESGDISPEIEDKFFDLIKVLLPTINDIPALPKKGYGAYKASRPLYKNFDKATKAAISIYAGKFSKEFGPQSKWGHIESVLNQFYELKKQENISSFSVVSFDMNLKNFIMDNHGQVHLLNLPILGFSQPEAGLGEMTSQLRNSSLHKRLINFYVSKGMDRGWIIFHETIGLLGTLSAATSNDFSYVEEVECWGYKANVSESIQKNIKELELLI